MAKELKTEIKPNGARITYNIPKETATCQYYKTVVPGDIAWGGHVVTQEDIDNDVIRYIGFNCGSPEVDWMPDVPTTDPYSSAYYYDNPIIGGLIDDGEGNQLFENGQLPCEEPGDPGCNGCNVNGLFTCQELIDLGDAGGGGGGGGGGGTDSYEIVQKCCNALTGHFETDLDAFDGANNELGTYGACNQMDCGGANNHQDAGHDGLAYVHHEPKCVYPMGPPFNGYVSQGEDVIASDASGYNQVINNRLLTGKGHNIVWNHFNKQQQLASSGNGDYFRYYPYWNIGAGTNGKMYYKDDNSQNSSDAEYWAPTYFNDRLDRRQRGVNKAGQELYNLPVWVATTCQDRISSGITAGSITGAVNSYKVNDGMNGTQIGGEGIITCPEVNEDANGLIDTFYNNTAVQEYLAQYFDSLTTDKIQEFNGSLVTDAPSFETGFGMDYLNDSNINLIRNGIIPSNTGIPQSTLVKDMMFRLGAPLPPIVMGYESVGNLPGHLQECEGIGPLYNSLITEFEEFLEIGTFFADFGIPNIKIEPTMVGLLDVYSARDLREEKINACDYVEFMTLPGGNLDGDGIYYKGSELDTEDSYLLNFDCNTEFNQDISGYSRMRAVCKDGSTVLIANTGNNQNTQLNHTNTDKIFNTGKDACNSKIKPYSNQELYYLADGDLRESLGINFFETENTEQSTNNFIGNIIDDNFEQIPFYNLLSNGDGRLVNSNFQWNSNEFTADDSVFDGVPYIAENWIPIMQYHNELSTYGDNIGIDQTIFRSLEYRTQNEGEDNEYKNFQYGGMMPYWSANNYECFSRRKCLIIDTMNPSPYQDGDNPLNDGTQDVYHNEWDIRQVMQTWIATKNVPSDSRRKNSKFKVSFMMKTIDKNADVDLKNTGIHLNAVFSKFEADWKKHVSGESPPSYLRNYSKDASGWSSTDENKLWPIVPFSNSQCSANSHPDNHMEIHPQNTGLNLPIDEFCKKSKASFTNTELNKWEKMEFTFTPRYGDGNGQFPNWDSVLMGGGETGIKLLFMPLELSKTDERFISRDGGNVETTNGTAFNSTGVSGTDFNNVANSYGNTIFANCDITRNGAKIYLDNFEFKEDFSFHPDVDVRKNKGLNEYGNISLTQYSESDDANAPLEAQFYFYPRYNFDDMFSKDRKVIVEQFKFGQFYISDIDWGDASPIEYSNEPFKLGVDKMLYHTYESNGVYEVKGTMFQIKSDSYTYSLATPEDISYEGIAGIAHNKKFNLKIYIGIGQDEDFKYFGSEGYAFIPYKQTLPIVGGISNQSIYLKSLKRNAGLLTDDDVIDIGFDSLNDKLNSEHALSKINSSFDDKLEVLKTYKKSIVNEADTSVDYLNTLPFPQYFEEFNIHTTIPTLTDQDITLWEDRGRPDIGNAIQHFISSNQYPSVSTAAESAYSFPPETFFNPTVTQNGVWNGGEYNNFQSELGKSIGDVDLTSIKYYNEPKSIWEMFGFEEDDLNIIGNPIQPRYWKNIIPQDYSIFNRNGLGDEIINTFSEQNWLDDYYYPVLPKYGLDGRFVDIKTDEDDNVISGYPKENLTLQPGSFGLDIENSNTLIWGSQNLEITVETIPSQISQIVGESTAAFNLNGTWIGGLTELIYGKLYTFILEGNESFTWDTIPADNFKIPFSLGGLITNNNDESLIVNIENEKYNSNIFNDMSGNGNKGFIINDYKPKFDNKTFKPKKTSFIDTIKTSKNNGAF